MVSSKLFRWVLVIFLFIGIVIVLVYAKPFLAPLAFAGVLSLFLFPVTRWLERKGLPRSVGALGGVLTFLAGLALIFILLGWQLSDLAKDSQQIEQQVTQKVSELKGWLATSMGIPPEKQQQILKQQQQKPGGTASGFTAIIAGFGTVLTDFLLMLIYMFLLIYLRSHFVNFILRLVPAGKKEETKTIIGDSQEAIQKYFTGMAMMIVGLWIMYGIGFSIVGVKSPIFFAMLCGTLEIIPFVGNIAGTAITMLMSIGQGADMNTILGIVIVYAVVQFIQSYILEPLVVGKEVKINPFFTIAGIIAGEVLWGVPGMILAIPTMAICKIIFDHTEALQPYGYLIGEEKEKKSRSRKRG